MRFEFASSVTCSQLINLHQRLFFLFFYFEGGESFNVGFLFFTISSAHARTHTHTQKNKKKNPDVLGILIICQHYFTFIFFKKIVLSIFIPKILPII